MARRMVSRPIDCRHLGSNFQISRRETDRPAFLQSGEGVLTLASLSGPFGMGCAFASREALPGEVYHGRTVTRFVRRSL